MDAIVPEWAHSVSGIGSLSTFRTGGVSLAPYDDGSSRDGGDSGGSGLNLGIHVGDDPEHVRQNRLRLQSLLPSEPVWLSQVHGVTVFDADREDARRPEESNAAGGPARTAPQADACVTSVRGRVCAIQTADCLPVLFCDREGRVAGAAHAGWRGLSGGVLERTVQAMKAKGAGDIQAWLGPAIGPTQFEVGEDVLQAFAAKDAGAAEAFSPIPERQGKYLADIYALARRALARTGIRDVSGGGYCTMTERERFYSYRRDGVTGRMASLIWLK